MSSAKFYRAVQNVSCFFMYCFVAGAGVSALIAVNSLSGYAAIGAGLLGLSLFIAALAVFMSGWQERLQ